MTTKPLPKQDVKPRGLVCPTCGCRHFEVVYTRATPIGTIRRRLERVEQRHHRRLVVGRDLPLQRAGCRQCVPRRRKITEVVQFLV